MQPLGLIAGSGRFPLLLARSYKKDPHNRIEAIGFVGETSRELERYVDHITWIGVGQFGQLLEIFEKADIKKAVMAGQITPTRMFDEVEFDPEGFKLFAGLRDKKADTVFTAVAEQLAESGIELIDSTLFLKNFLPKEGILTKTRPTEGQLSDIEFGKNIAKEMGRLDIGQTIVVKNRAILAVEALEGTDETIKRGGKLGKGEVVIVKMAKPGQDMRFDVPVIGEKTIQTMVEANAVSIAIEAEKTLILDEEKTISLANNNNISIVAI